MVANDSRLASLAVEQRLAKLGIRRIPIPIPYREAGGPVNVYAIEEADGGVLLFDAGLGTLEAEATLEQGLAAAGYGLGDVRRIVVSHGHIDHFGGARTVVEKSGRELPVLAHPLDIPKMAEGGGQDWHDRLLHFAAYFPKLGVPLEAMAAASGEAHRGMSMARLLPVVQPLPMNEPLRAKHVVLEPLHVPGHTPGLVCLYDREHRLLLSSDHLLEKTSPNPIIELGPNGEEGVFRPLSSYIASIERVRELEIDLVLPGHSGPFGDHRGLIRALLGFYEQRQDKIATLLASHPATAFEVAQALFPRASPRQLLLTVSESIANLEVMEERGKVTRHFDAGVYRFAPAS